MMMTMRMLVVMQAKREAVQAVYESRPLAADHKVKDVQLGQMDIA